MKKHFTIELQNIAPEKKETPFVGEWKQLVKIGNYGTHPKYGTIEFTPQMLDSFYDNFRSKTIGRDVFFNYDHDGKTKAALWITDLRKIQENGQTVKLEYLPEYTPSGYQLISGKEYKYVSLEYETEGKHGAVLWGGGCTNDPFVVGDGLTELSNNQNLNKKEELTMAETAELMKKLENLESKITKLTAAKETEVKTPEAVKLEAENKELRIKLQKEEEARMKVQLEAFQVKWTAERVPGGMIALAKERIAETKNGKIKLSRSTGEVETDLLSYTEELFGKLPEDSKVNLSAESGVWIKQPEGEAKKDDKTEAIKLMRESAEALNKRRGGK